MQDIRNVVIVRGLLFITIIRSVSALKVFFNSIVPSFYVSFNMKLFCQVKQNE